MKYRTVESELGTFVLFARANQLSRLDPFSLEGIQGPELHKSMITS